MNTRAWTLILAISLPLAVPAQEAKPSIERSSKTSAVPYIEMTDLIEKVAKRTGKQFIVDPRVRASVRLVGFGTGDVDYQRLLAILRVHAFVAVEENGFVTVVPDAGARQLAVATHFGLGFEALDDELVTVILEVKNTCAAQLVPVLRPLMPQAAHMAADLQSNSLIINDRASNVRRIGDVVERLDRATPAGRICEPPASAGGAPK